MLHEQWKEQTFAAGAATNHHRTEGTRDFTAIALPGVCSRSIRLQVRHAHRRVAADIAIPVIQSQSEARNSSRSFAATGTEKQGAGLGFLHTDRVFGSARLLMLERFVSCLPGDEGTQFGLGRASFHQGFRAGLPLAII